MKLVYLNLRMHAASLCDLTHACVVLGRLLISLIAVLLPAMVWTERFSTWDRFFQGGQDCELGILAVFAFLCLAILLSQRCKQTMALRLAAQRFFSFVARRSRRTAFPALLETLALFFLERTPCHPLRMCSLQLRI